MAISLVDFVKQLTPAHQANIQKELYRRADLEINGDDEYYDTLGNLVEQHPICSPGVRSHALRSGLSPIDYQI